MAGVVWYAVAMWYCAWLVIARFEFCPWLQCTSVPYLRATGWRPSAADWGSGMSVVLRRGSIVHYRGQWVGACCAAVPLAHANQLPLPRM